MPKYQLKFPEKRPPTLLIIGVVIIAVLGIIVFGARFTYNQALKPVNSSEKSQLITIPSGASVKEIAAILDDANVIREGWAFEWYVRNSNARDSLKAGTYALRPSQSVAEIVTILSQGNIATDLVTILPAKRLDEIRDGLINSGFTPESVDQALNPALYTNHPALVDKPTDASLEGYLYPESFQKTADTKPETIITASLDQMQKYLTPELRAGIVAQGLTVHQGVILASIIEQEVDNAPDKAKVAQVFLKRFRANMLLQSDPTADYGAILDGEEPSLFYDSPYNTYKYKGLTPGPISNVTFSSLDAVAKPASTDFLYFVSGDDGTTYFSKTLEEHESLTKQHCTKLCGNN